MLFAGPAEELAVVELKRLMRFSWKPPLKLGHRVKVLASSPAVFVDAEISQKTGMRQ